MHSFHYSVVINTLVMLNITRHSTPTNATANVLLSATKLSSVLLLQDKLFQTTHISPLTIQGPCHFPIHSSSPTFACLRWFPQKHRFDFNITWQSDHFQLKCSKCSYRWVLVRAGPNISDWTMLGTSLMTSAVPRRPMCKQRWLMSGLITPCLSSATDSSSSKHFNTRKHNVEHEIISRKK